MKPLAIICVLAALGPAAIAQQTGDANRNYIINGSGSMQSSPVATPVAMCPSCPGVQSLYQTGDPGAPILWLLASQGAVGWLITPNNSIDIGPIGFEILLDGTDALNPLAPFLTTNSQGDFAMTLPVSQSLQGSSLYLAMAHLSPSSADGFYISQTHNVSFGVNNLAPSQFPVQNPTSATSLFLLDDTAQLRSLPFTFNFYGTLYSDVYVCDNGFLSFGVSNSDPTETVSGLISGPPRVAGLWNNMLLESLNGITVKESQAGSTPFITFRWTVEWLQVPIYGAGGTVSFSITLEKQYSGFLNPPTYRIHLDYGDLNTVEGVVGISPGFGTGGGGSPPGLPLNLSVPSNTLAPTLTAYEAFSPTNAIDLAGSRVTWQLGTNGAPTVQN